MIPIPTIIAAAALHTMCPHGAVVYNDSRSTVQHGIYRVSGNECSAVVACDQKHVLVFRGSYDGPLNSPSLCAKYVPLIPGRDYIVGPRPGRPCIVTKTLNQDCDYTKREDREKMEAQDIMRNYPDSK